MLNRLLHDQLGSGPFEALPRPSPTFYTQNTSSSVFLEDQKRRRVSLVWYVSLFLSGTCPLIRDLIHRYSIFSLQFLNFPLCASVWIGFPAC